MRRISDEGRVFVERSGVCDGGRQCAASVSATSATPSALLACVARSSRTQHRSRDLKGALKRPKKWLTGRGRAHQAISHEGFAEQIPRIADSGSISCGSCAISTQRCSAVRHRIRTPDRLQNSYDASARGPRCAEQRQQFELLGRQPDLLVPRSTRRRLWSMNRSARRCSSTLDFDVFHASERDANPRQQLHRTRHGLVT